LSLPALAQDFSFNPLISSGEFRQLNLIVGQSIYPTPIDPAVGRGLLRFDIGVGAVAVPVDDRAAYWVNAVDADILTEGYLAVPRIIVSKGFFGIHVSGTYAQIPDSDAQILGGTVDVPIIDGGLIRPTFSIRGAYGELRGVDEYSLKVYGAEAFLSKTIGPVTPYVAAGLMRTDAQGRVFLRDVEILRLTDEAEDERYTIGARISLLVPKISIEATQGEELTYSAKVSLGF
jgi:hypothetical protein